MEAPLQKWQEDFAFAICSYGKSPERMPLVPHTTKPLEERVKVKLQ